MASYHLPLHGVSMSTNPLDALLYDQGLTITGQPLNPPKDVSAYYPGRTIPTLAQFQGDPEAQGRAIPSPGEFIRTSNERRERVNAAIDSHIQEEVGVARPSVTPSAMTAPQPISNRYGEWTDGDVLAEIMKRETDIQELYYLAIARGIPLADALQHKWQQMYYVTHVMYALATGSAVGQPQPQSHAR